MRAHVPTNSGDDRLVPPTCVDEPFTMILAPLFGSPSNATSATPRCVPVQSVCQLGFGSNVLWLPPESTHTVSLDHVVVVAFNVVPATAMTYCDAAGQLGVGPPVPHSSAPESPVETEIVWPCASAVEKI